jgi:tetratricopeptide (TPR) repeat protein
MPFPYVNLSTALQLLDRLDEAEAAMRLAAERKVEIPEIMAQRYALAFLKNDRAEMERVVAASQGKPGAEDWITYSEGFFQAYHGQLARARETLGRATGFARKAGQPERVAQFGAGTALWEAFYGNSAAARRGATALVKASDGRDVQYGAVLALALSGDVSAAQPLTEALAKRFPEDTDVQFSYLPTLRSVLALRRGEPGKALEALKTAEVYELSVPGSWFTGSFGALYPVYFRGEAHLAAGHHAEAAADFQKIVDHRAIVLMDPISALAHWRLGRALAASGDTTRAKKAYQDFFALWNEADSEIPILKTAKAEYAALP